MISLGSQSQVIPLNEAHYCFFAPGNAPPCEVYKLLPLTLVPCTLELVAVYLTHAVLSMHDATFTAKHYISLESSLNYSLEKQSKRGLALRVSFTVRGWLLIFTYICIQCPIQCIHM